MENAADALKMAAAILIFIIAIASSFSLFGTAKQTADSIITMKDKQAYLAAAELDNGILYTSSSAISGTEELDDTTKAEESTVAGVTKNGDRIVNVDDVVSTILRYNKEKYGVTIVKASNGEVIRRFDGNTENVMRQWNNITTGKEEYVDKLEDNTKNSYKGPVFSVDGLVEIYGIHVAGNANIECGAPWYGNDVEIQNRISAELSGEKYEYIGQTFNEKPDSTRDGLMKILSESNKIIEVINEIDESDYIKDGTNETSLLAGGGYQLPTIEIIYIVY